MLRFWKARIMPNTAEQYIRVNSSFEHLLGKKLNESILSDIIMQRRTPYTPI